MNYIGAYRWPEYHRRQLVFQSHIRVPIYSFRFLHFHCIAICIFPIIMDARLRRVNKEILGRFPSFMWGVSTKHHPIVDCKNDKASNIVVDLIDNSPFHLRGSFNGPEDTPYEGGHFEVAC